MTVGQISKPFGVNGWVRVRSFTAPAENLLTYRPWYIARQPDLAGWRELSPLQGRKHGCSLVAKFEGFEDPESVHEICGMKIGVCRSAFGSLAEGEYYWVDLLGTDVKTETGTCLGNIVQVIETGANSVMQVEGEGRKRMIPFADPILKQVSPGKEIVVDWDPEWP